MGHRPSDLASFDNFAERFAVGIFANEAWVENVPSIAWEGSYAAKWTNGSASFVVVVHSSTVGLQTRARSTRNRRTGLCRGKLIRWVLVGRNVGFCAVTTMAWEAFGYTSFARTTEEITTKYPELTVIEERPAWMTAGEEPDENMTFNIDKAPTGWLREIAPSAALYRRSGAPF